MVVELVDTLVSEASASRCAGSSPALRTRLKTNEKPEVNQASGFFTFEGSL